MKSVSCALKWQSLTSCVETSTLNHSTESSFAVILNISTLSGILELLGIEVSLDWCGSGPWVPNRLLEFNFSEDSGLFLD